MAMKRFMVWAMVGTLAVLWTAGTVAAQDRRPREGRGSRGGFGMMRADPMERKATIDKAITSLGLEGETKEKVAKIQKEYAAKLDEQAAKNKDRLAEIEKELQTAREERNREKMQQLRQEQRQLMGGTAEIVREYETAVKNALPEEMKGKFEQALLPPPPAREMLAACQANGEALGLSEEQTSAVKKLADEYGKEAPPPENIREKMAEIQNSDRSDEEKRAARQELFQKMRTEREQAQKRDQECMEKLNKILSAEQQKKLQEMVRKRMQEQRRGGEGADRPRRGEGEGRRGEGRRGGGQGTRTDDSSAGEGEPKPDGMIE